MGICEEIELIRSRDVSHVPLLGLRLDYFMCSVYWMVLFSFGKVDMLRMCIVVLYLLRFVVLEFHFEIYLILYRPNCKV